VSESKGNLDITSGGDRRSRASLGGDHLSGFASTRYAFVSRSPDLINVFARTSAHSSPAKWVWLVNQDSATRWRRC
jgi:hypothetical protein